MGSYSDHKRTYRANRSHCSLGWQRNDRLGRASLRIRSPSDQHRGKLLRAIRCADSDPDANSDSDANADSNSYRDGDADAHSYIYTKTYAHAEEHTIGQAAPDSPAAPIG